MRATVLILALCFSISAASASCRIFGPTVLSVKTHFGTKVTYQAESDPKRRKECHDLINERLLDPDRYGLESLDKLSEDYIDRGDHILISARGPNGELLSVSRYIPNTDLSRFKNIDHSKIKHGPYQQGEIATVNFYSADPLSKLHRSIFDEGIRLAIEKAVSSGVRAFYSETTEPTYRYVSKYGTKLLTDWFQPRGWKKEFRGGIWEFEEGRRAIVDPVFRLKWRELYGSTINLRKLKFMYQNIDLDHPL